MSWDRARHLVQAGPGKPAWRLFDLRKGKQTKPKPCYNVEVEGWDTETTPDGYARIAASSNGWREVEEESDIISVLAGRGSLGKKNSWWNLDFDVTALCKWFDGCLEAFSEEEPFVHDSGWIFEYIPRKLLKVRKGKNVAWHYDFAQFYGMGLEAAAREYLDRRAPEIKGDREYLWGTYSTKEIGEYCQWDATATRDLAQMYIDRLHNIGLYPKHFISNGNLCQSFILTNADVPTWRDNPNFVNLYAWASMRGALIDIWKRGEIRGWKYDLKSAYPASLMQLPDFRKGEWVREYLPDCEWGFANAIVTYNKDTFPLLGTFWNGGLVYPNYGDSAECWLTFDELRFLQKHAKSCKIQSAVSFIPHSEDRPWLDLMLRFQELQEASRGNQQEYDTTKQLKNSTYGKTVEKMVLKSGRIRPGRLFNPVAGSFTLARTRVTIGEACAGKLDRVAGLATDCVMSTAPLGIEDDSGEIGSWELEKEDTPAILLQPGIYQFDGERPHTRGFKRHGFDNLWDACRFYGSSLPIHYDRPISGREAVLWGRPKDAGVFRSSSYRVGIENSRRLWDWNPSRFGELLGRTIDSQPVPSAVLDWEA